MLAAWALPALLLPPAWFAPVGVSTPAVEHVVFVRLWGAATFALVVEQALAWRAPTRHAGAVLVGIVAHGFGAVVIASVGAGGGFASWSALATAYAWASALVMAGFALALGTKGQPLLRRLAERPRAGSVKIM